MDLSVDRSFSHWWVFLVRGILFVLVGIWMIASPIVSFVALGFFFGLIIFIAGLSELLHVVRDKTAANRGWHLFLGIVDVILGIVLMGHVATSVAILRIVVGIWFLLRGILIIRFSRAVGRSWALTIGGIITAIFGLMIIFNGVFGSMTIILFIAIAFIFTGIFNIWLGMRMKSH
jgi:uncharacterized membrane protein HdeD (DUF308 family)